MQSKNIIRVFLFVLIILWMILIFCFSNQNGEESSQISRDIAQKIVSIENNVDTVEMCIRKIAHLTEYAIGGCLFLLLLRTYEISENKQILIALMLGFINSVFDEIHQLFIDGRSGQATDVIIDTIGVSLGIMILMLLIKVIKITYYKGKQKGKSGND